VQEPEEFSGMGKKIHRKVDKVRCEPPVSVTCGEAKKKSIGLNGRAEKTPLLVLHLKTTVDMNRND